MQKRLMIDYMLRYDLLGLSLNDVKKVNDESEKTFWGHQFFCSFLPPHLGLLHKMQRSSRSIKVCFSPSDLHALIVLCFSLLLSRKSFVVSLLCCCRKTTFWWLSYCLLHPSSTLKLLLYTAGVSNTSRLEVSVFTTLDFWVSIRAK